MDFPAVSGTAPARSALCRRLVALRLGHCGAGVLREGRWTSGPTHTVWQSQDGRADLAPDRSAGTTGCGSHPRRPRLLATRRQPPLPAGPGRGEIHRQRRPGATALVAQETAHDEMVA